MLKNGRQPPSKLVKCNTCKFAWKWKAFMWTHIRKENLLQDLDTIFASCVIASLHVISHDMVKECFSFAMARIPCFLFFLWLNVLAWYEGHMLLLEWIKFRVLKNGHPKTCVFHPYRTMTFVHHKSQQQKRRTTENGKGSSDINKETSPQSSHKKDYVIRFKGPTNRLPN